MTMPSSFVCAGDVVVDGAEGGSQVLPFVRLKIMMGFLLCLVDWLIGLMVECSTGGKDGSCVSRGGRFFLRRVGVH